MKKRKETKPKNGFGEQEYYKALLGYTFCSVVGALSLLVYAPLGIIMMCTGQVILFLWLMQLCDVVRKYSAIIEKYAKLEKHDSEGNTSNDTQDKN